MHQNNYLICYDITDAKRLQRVQRLIAKQLLQVQYSVYYGTMYPSQIDTLIKRIKTMISTKQDNVTVYQVQAIEDGILVGKRSNQVMLFADNGKRITW